MSGFSASFGQQHGARGYPGRSFPSLCSYGCAFVPLDRSGTSRAIYLVLDLGRICDACCDHWASLDVSVLSSPPCLLHQLQTVAYACCWKLTSGGRCAGAAQGKIYFLAMITGDREGTGRGQGRR